MSSRKPNLLDAAVAGDRAALSSLLEAHGTRVRSVIEKQIGSKWNSRIDADDVLQITYLEVFLRIHTFEPRGEEAFFKWLLRAAENNLRDAIRGLRAAKRAPVEAKVVSLGGTESTEAFFHQQLLTTTTPSRHMAAADIDRTVRDALSRLPPDYASLIRMYELECQPIDVVARALGRSEAAVYMLRARAIDHLRRIVTHESGFFETRR